MDTGEGYGVGTGEVQVEEVFAGLPADVKTVGVFTMARSSCYVRLPKGERWVVFGFRKRGSMVVHSGGCTFSHQVRGDEKWLAALRDARSGDVRTIAGTALDGTSGRQADPAPGVELSVSNGKELLKTSTDANGEFEFRHVSPGEWTLAVTQPGMAMAPELEQSKVVVPETGCTYTEFRVWPNGQIAGTIRDVDGAPMPNVPVAAYIVDDEGGVKGYPFATAHSDADGSYLIGALPPGIYVVGVNGSGFDYEQKVPWPPLFYPAERQKGKGRRLQLDRAGRLNGIDLALDAPRPVATLLVEAVFEDDQPATEIDLSLHHAGSDLPKFFKGRDVVAEIPNLYALPVFEGENYKLQISSYRVSGVEQSIRHAAALPRLTINEKVVRVRLVLRTDTK